MIQLPENFDVSALFSDFTDLSEPFVKLSLLTGAFYIIINFLRKNP